MKKLLIAAFMLPTMALAQTYPSPTFNSLTLQNPLTAVNGGTGATSATGSGSVVLSSSPTLTNPAITGSLTATGLVTTADLAAQAANTVLANVTGSSASPTAFAMPSCSTIGFLQWTSGTGFTCGATGIFTSVGVGVSSASAPLDIETNGAVGGGSANGALARFYAGSSGTPVTAITPTVGISRYEAINQDTEGGQNPALYVQSTGNNTWSSGVIPQVAGITSNVSQIGTGDSVAFYGLSKNSSTASGHFAYGLFAQAWAATAGTNAYALETFTNNGTGSNAPLTVGATPAMVGWHATPNGGKNSTSAVWFSNDTNGSGSQWDTGIYFSASSVVTASFIDASSSVDSLKVQGSHTNGLNLTAGTFTGNQITGTGFAVDPNGMMKSTVNPTATWSEDHFGSAMAIANGANQALPAGNGLVVVEESVGSNSAMYLCSAGSCTMIGANGAAWVASTTTPAAGKLSVAYSGSAYTIYNNQGASETVSVDLVRMKSSN